MLRYFIFVWNIIYAKYPLSLLRFIMAYYLYSMFWLISTIGWFSTWYLSLKKFSINCRQIHIMLFCCGFTLLYRMQFLKRYKAQFFLYNSLKKAICILRIINVSYKSFSFNNMSFFDGLLI